MMLKHRARFGVEQGERTGEHVVLELGILWLAERTPGKSHQSARGGWVRSTTDRVEASVTVAMPAASKTWASTLTVRVQSGQTG